MVIFSQANCIFKVGITVLRVAGFFWLVTGELLGGRCHFFRTNSFNVGQ